MATHSMLGILLSTLTVTTLAACGSDVSGGGSGDPVAPTTPTTAPTTPPPGAGLAYPGHGFIVHEWGTNTIVVGSDGSLQRGLHHEEEDLPKFVYDRVKAGTEIGGPSVAVSKMETPVTYFYSDKPRSVDVAVDFPAGVLTQWYPAVVQFSPPMLMHWGGPQGEQVVDPVLDPTVKFDIPSCKEQYSHPATGRLDWGQVNVLARDAARTLPTAPLTESTWSYARGVAANTVEISTATGPQDEQFLFYRGLGNLDFPLQVGSLPGGKIAVSNPSKIPMGRLFVINVGNGKGAFTVKESGIVGGEVFEPAIPSLDGALDVAAYSDALAVKVTEALDATGLYHDEARAMVSTWKRQWFGTPGVRVLYLMPQSWTDAAIPLTITPPPDEALRVMMIRVEVITPETEQVDAMMAKLLGDAKTAAEGEAHFQSLGRFAEPRLRRALTIVGDPALGQAFLATVTSAETRAGVGE
ncbi:MAG: hypothetical protein ABJE95_19055 [Byssovorax sp.]